MMSQSENKKLLKNFFINIITSGKYDKSGLSRLSDYHIRYVIKNCIDIF